MLESLKEEVLKANLELVKQNLVIYTFGNVSAINKERNLIVIKPSGVDYSHMKKEDMVIVDLTGNIVEGSFKPSSDTLTHLELYKKYSSINAIVHAHSTWATQWSQAKRSIPIYGTTHADYFHGDIPCTRELTKEEIENEYEKNTGKVIIETFRNLNVETIPGVLCESHGPFSWGKNPMDAVQNAKVLEECAKMAYYTEQIARRKIEISKYLIDKHYYRKNGKKAYYGQNTQ